MSRPANPARPHELLDAVFAYLTKHGLADLSLRPLAKAARTSPRVLLYFFGSKEEMISLVLKKIREQQRSLYREIKAQSLAEAGWSIWQHLSSPGSEPALNLFFEAYGIALRHPRQYESFLRATIHDWLHFVSRSLAMQHLKGGVSEGLATALLAGFRGFMLDLCATQERKRIDSSVRLWLQGMETIYERKRRK